MDEKKQQKPDSASEPTGFRFVEWVPDIAMEHNVKDLLNLHRLVSADSGQIWSEQLYFAEQLYWLNEKRKEKASRTKES